MATIVTRLGPPSSARVNLNFHGIDVPRGRDFGVGERDFWVTRALLEAVLDAVADRADVRLSFDDGNTSDIEIALPALRARRMSATFFIVPGWLGTRGFITTADVRTLVQNGMTIGNHGLAHHRWTELTRRALNRDAAEGRLALERLTGTDIGTLAIPYGAYDETILETLRGHGYEHVFTSDGGGADPDAWLQPREHLRAHHTLADLDRMLAVAPSRRSPPRASRSIRPAAPAPPAAPAAGPPDR